MCLLLLMNILYLGLSKYFIFFNWFKNLCLINLLHIHFDLGNILILFCILIFNKFATSPSELGECLVRLWVPVIGTSRNEVNFQLLSRPSCVVATIRIWIVSFGYGRLESSSSLACNFVSESFFFVLLYHKISFPENFSFFSFSLILL